LGDLAGCLDGNAAQERDFTGRQRVFKVQGRDLAGKGTYWAILHTLTMF
jgi:hypothetical protein